MQCTKIPFSNIPQLSKTDKAYANQEEDLRPFYQYAPKLESFAQLIADKSQDATNRPLLVSVLEEQYSGEKMDELVKNNIQSLAAEQTFTVTTAHQPSLFTGPLYYIYKIITTINLASRLAERYPEYHFVPVFVTGGEDHDFEEANHAHIFGKKLEWQSGESGSVGAMSTQSLAPVLEELKQVLGQGENAEFIEAAVIDAYTSNTPYSAATVALVNRLFGHKGLLVLNMNHPRLKRQFIPYFHKELLEQASIDLVNQTSEQLLTLGYKQQATPRAINLFYLQNQIRERIVKEGEVFKVLNTDLEFSVEEMAGELEKHPEHFSPNVVMRPLYQEVILPNLTYVGGGGELAYWLERKSQFAHFGVNFPMLMRRNSALWIDRGTSKKRRKLGLSIPQLFEDTESLIKLYVRNNATESLDFSIQKEQLKEIFEVYRQSAKQIDASLEKTVLAEEAKQNKAMDQLLGRMHRAEKQKHETALNQLRNLKEKLFPANGLQERKDNFIPLYLKYGATFFEELIKTLDPFDASFVIIEDEG